MRKCERTSYAKKSGRDIRAKRKTTEGRERKRSVAIILLLSAYTCFFLSENHHFTNQTTSPWLGSEGVTVLYRVLSMMVWTPQHLTLPTLISYRYSHSVLYSGW
jgi:hypothetical protein